jgi:hypothetical protein
MSATMGRVFIVMPAKAGIQSRSGFAGMVTLRPTIAGATTLERSLRIWPV